MKAVFSLSSLSLLILAACGQTPKTVTNDAIDAVQTVVPCSDKSVVGNYNFRVTDILDTDCKSKIDLKSCSSYEGDKSANNCSTDLKLKCRDGLSLITLEGTLVDRDPMGYVKVGVFHTVVSVDTIAICSGTYEITFVWTSSK